jgi:RNA polymerase sigma-70 factor (ECF subfamily)
LKALIIVTATQKATEVQARMREIFDAHSGDVWRTARFLGVRESDLADVSQEVFLTVHRRLPSFEGRSSLRTWIHGIVIRVVSAYRRRAHRRHEVVTSQLPDEAVDPEQEQRLISQERAGRLEEAVARLDDKQRLVFVLYELQELAMKDVATSLEIPLQTAYSRLKAAHRSIRDTFERVSDG